MDETGKLSKTQKQACGMKFSYSANSVDNQLRICPLMSVRSTSAKSYFYTL